MRPESGRLGGSDKIGINRPGRRALLHIPLALCLVFRPGTAGGEEAAGPPVTVQTEVDRAEITVGDPIVFTVTVRHEPRRNVSTPGPGFGLDDFEVRSFRHLEAVTESGRVRRGVQYVLTSYQTGITHIPSLPLVHWNADGSADTLHTQPIKIEVRSVLPADMEDIRDIKEPVLPPPATTLILAAAAGALLILIAAWMVFRYLKRRRAGVDQLGPAPIPSRPPYEVALESLEQIKREGLLSDGRTKEYYSRVADTVRVYLEGRFGIPAMELATAETLKLFDSAGGAGTGLGKMLRLADLVKFAKLTPPIDGGIACMEEAHNFLELTRPAEIPAEPEAAAVATARETAP